MDPKTSIQPLTNRYSQQIVDLILPIQQDEFKVPITLQQQQDLLDIETFYVKPGGRFWGAFQEEKLAGTIAFLPIGHEAGIIRKMFVSSAFRGKDLGLAQLLLNELIQYSRSTGIKKIYLGTIDTMKAAHRFYERNGFHRIDPEQLPSYFPRMPVDNTFYELDL